MIPNVIVPASQPNLTKTGTIMFYSTFPCPKAPPFCHKCEKRAAFPRCRATCYRLFLLYPAQRAGALSKHYVLLPGRATSMVLFSAICFAIYLSFPPCNEPKKDRSDEYGKVECFNKENSAENLPPIQIFFILIKDTN